MLYTVVAYRYGCLNDHHYHVAATADEDVACNIAEEECNDRGGKYGVAVYAWSSATEHKQHAYFPSLAHEDAPYHNRRVDMYEALGHNLHTAVTTATVHDAEKTGDGLFRNIPRAIEAPEWAVEFVRQQEQRLRFVETVDEDLKARKDASLGMRTKEENSAWCKEQSARIAVEVNEFLAQAQSKQAAALERYWER